MSAEKENVDKEYKGVPKFFHELKTFQLFDIDNVILDRGFEIFKKFYNECADDILHMQFINGIMFVYIRIIQE